MEVLIAEGTTDPAAQWIGFGAIGTSLMIINQFFNWWREKRKEDAALKAAALLAATQARRDDVAIRKEEAALCNDEDDRAIAGYEKLLARYNTRLVEVEAEVKDLRKELSLCQQNHAREEERAKHLEARLTDLDRKYTVLKKKIPGIDSDTVLMPEDIPEKK